MAAPNLKEPNWTIESNASGPTSRMLTWGAFAVVGILLLAFGHFCTTHPESVLWMRTRGGRPVSPADSALFGYYGGAIALLVSVLGYFFSEDILTTVDCDHKRLVVRYQNKMSSRFQMIPFQEIQSVSVTRSGINGKNPETSLVHVFTLRARLRDGGRLSFGKSSINEVPMTNLAQRLADSTGAEFVVRPSSDGFAGFGDQVRLYAISAAGSLGLMYLFYKFHGSTFAEMMRCPSTPLYLALLILVISTQLRRFLRPRY